jgi:hypothetical protein
MITYRLNPGKDLVPTVQDSITVNQNVTNLRIMVFRVFTNQVITILHPVVLLSLQQKGESIQ